MKYIRLNIVMYREKEG